MNGFTFPRYGKHSHTRLNAARNSTRRPRNWLNPTSFFERLVQGVKTLFQMTRALPSAKLWRAVQRRRGTRGNYYRKPQESGA